MAAFPTSIPAFADIPAGGAIPMDSAEPAGIDHDEYEEQQSAEIVALATALGTAAQVGRTLKMEGGRPYAKFADGLWYELLFVTIDGVRTTTFRDTAQA